MLSACEATDADRGGAVRASTLSVGRIARRRLVQKNSTHHCTWRAHDLLRVLEDPEAKQFFLDLLLQHKEEHGILIHSYCLMGSHPHVHCKTTRGVAAFSAFWHVVNSRFAHWYNEREQRRGQVIMERMLSPAIQEGRHQLVVMRYGDLNPVRAGMVQTPKDYPWSSYRHYAFGEPNPLITDAPEYLALGATAAARRAAYVHLFATPLEDALLQPRPDLVSGPWVGEADWVEERRTMETGPPRAPD
jgi:putative transposase